MSETDISLIIRYSRPATIGRAIDSALNQIWASKPPSLEVLVIDTLGSNTPCPALIECGLTSLTSPCPTRSQNAMLRWVTEHRPLNRPEALETGIRNARGHLSLFLDDDDLLTEQHIEKLYQGILAARADDPHVVAVTSGVNFIHETVAGQDLQHLHSWDAPLAPERLILANQLPLMAFIVQTQTLRDCQVDRRLEIYEDWDLLIQLSRRGRFLHLPGVTAYYFFNPSGSGVHDPLKAEETSRAIREKWVNTFTRADFEKMYQSLINADHLTLENDSLRKKLANAEQELQLITNSHSWQLTKPLRALRRWCQSGRSTHGGSHSR